MQQNGVCGSNSVVVDIVETVAEATGRDPRSLHPPLNDVVDPDALEQLIDGDGLTRVSFEYSGRTVVVDGDGRVTVDEPVTAGSAIADD